MASNLLLFAVTLVFPPAGWVLMWRRPGKAWIKLLGTAAIALVGIAELFLLYGLRVELDGSTARPFFTFASPESRAAAVERHRAQQESAPPVPARSIVGETVAEAAAPAEPVAAPAAAPPPPAVAIHNYWTDFRGPGRKGIYDEMPILTSWPATGLKRLWKQPIGGGYASFSVGNGLAYTIEQRRGEEVVAAYEVATGREVWTHAWKARFFESMGGEGPRTTPVFDSGRVYALGALGELRVLDARTGKLVWNKNILTDNGAENPMWAQAASPLLVDGMVIVLPGGAGGKSVVAYDKATGTRVWSALDDQQAYVSPIEATLAGKRQLVVVSARRVMGLTIEDGALLWEFPWATQYDVNATVPIVVAPDRFFISSGYGHGAAVVELTPNSGGEGAPFTTRAVWQNGKMKTKFNDAVLHQGHIYGLDEGILACVSAESGEQKWKGGRYGYGQVLLASGHLVILSERGELALVKADPGGHQEVARFEAIEGKTWNNPAIAGGVLLVRNEGEMAAFQIGR